MKISWRSIGTRPFTYTSGNSKIKQPLTPPRKKRLAELSTITTASVYNQVYHVQKPDYSKDVTEASNTAFVFVLLTSSQGTNTESRVLIEIWRDLAQRFGDVKFCQIRADLCIEGYPDKNTPTVLVYKDGDIRRQIVTLRELQGARTKAADFERVLLEVGAINHSDHRMQKRSEHSEDTEASRKTIKQGKNTSKVADDDDSDWD